MKLFSVLRNRLRADLLKNKRGQGATEYILLLVVIVGLVVTFGPKIKATMNTKMGDLDKDIQGVTSQ
jgi:hypothetical protein